MSIKNSINQILETIRETEQKCGRAENSVQLMAVSKFHSGEKIKSVIAEGITLFGENRVQEAIQKFPPLIQEFPHIELHQIGLLQRNKVKHIIPFLTCVQSVDRLELIMELEKCADKIQKPLSILLEMHTGEDSKSGFSDYESVKKALHFLQECKFVVPKGFMTMAPFTNDENLIRKSFRLLASYKERLQNDFKDFDLSELSMGMSNDYKIAIQEGSTLVRIGTAIFGDHN
ncbi:MAG: YggS family pyridoxal phosphate-dependent enzyme [Treponemataceae bacterium]